MSTLLLACEYFIIGVACIALMLGYLWVLEQLPRWMGFVGFGLLFFAICALAAYSAEHDE